MKAEIRSQIRFLARSRRKKFRIQALIMHLILNQKRNIRNGTHFEHR